MLVLWANRNNLLNYSGILFLICMEIILLIVIILSHEGVDGFMIFKKKSGFEHMGGMGRIGNQGMYVSFCIITNTLLQFNFQKNLYYVLNCNLFFCKIPF